MCQEFWIYYSTFWFQTNLYQCRHLQLCLHAFNGLHSSWHTHTLRSIHVWYIKLDIMTLWNIIIVSYYITLYWRSKSLQNFVPMVVLYIFEMSIKLNSVISASTPTHKIDQHPDQCSTIERIPLLFAIQLNDNNYIIVQFWVYLQFEWISTWEFFQSWFFGVL